MKKPVIEMWNILQIVPYELNAKTHDEKQVDKIVRSIVEFGWDQPIVVDKHGVVIKGHGRRLAAIKLGLTSVPVLVRADLSEDQVRAARLADNRVAVSNIDADILQKELASLNFDLEGIFDKKELDFMVADMGEMKMDAFVADLDAEIANQAAETVAKIEEVDGRAISIDKALGFKTVKGKDERHIVRFMAQVEAETGKTGAEAFVAFIQSVTSA